MKGYYICFGTTSTGVLKKIAMQMKELSSICETELLNVKVKKNRKLISKVVSLLPWEPIGFDYDDLLSQIIDPKFLYIRRVTADRDLIAFLKLIKIKYPTCKVIVECYTYPYDKDDFNRNLCFLISNIHHYVKDLIYRKQYKRCVDRFVTYSDDVSIFGVTTICTANGVDVNNEVQIEQKANQAIDLISVAHMQVHHGYERIIKGLYNYYLKGGKEVFKLHMVGGGPEADYYKKLVKKFGLDDNVIFYGKRTGSELDDIYKCADIALASFGLYKYDIEVISTLKMCEYLAKGFPVISGCKTSMLAPCSPDFILEFPNNESAINMNIVADFYHTVCEGKYPMLSNTIRQFAKDYMDMPVVMKPVIEYIINNNNEREN